jgi:tetratricopeptide (TPR) repeat protein
MDIARTAQLLGSHLAKADFASARKLAQAIKPRDLPDGSDPLHPQLVNALKVRSLAAEVLDYVGAFALARACVEGVAPLCEADLRDASDWSKAKISLERDRLLQQIWLLLQAGLSDYRRTHYESALRIFFLCKDTIGRVAAEADANPRWGTKARIHYSLGLVFRERNQLEAALDSFTISTEYAYNSLDHRTKSFNGESAAAFSWLTSIAIARSIGMGLASVHGTMGRTDLAIPLLLASKAMLPPDETLISTHLDMLRWNMRCSTVTTSAGLDEIIRGLSQCYKSFSEEEHSLYRSRAAQSLIQTYLQRGSIASKALSEEDLELCKNLLKELDARRSDDNRSPLYRLALESWMLRQEGAEAKCKRAEEVAARGLAQSNSTTHPHAYIELLTCRAKAREKLGNLAGAAHDFQLALEAARSANNSRRRAVFLLQLSRIHLLLHDRPNAVKYRREYRDLKSITKVCTGDVIQLEHSLEKLFEAQTGDFHLSLTDDLHDPDQRVAELRAFLVKWAKRNDVTDAVAAKRLGVGRTTLDNWRKNAP